VQVLHSGTQIVRFELMKNYQGFIYKFVKSLLFKPNTYFADIIIVAMIAKIE